MANLRREISSCHVASPPVTRTLALARVTNPICRVNVDCTPVLVGGQNGGEAGLDLKLS